MLKAKTRRSSKLTRPTSQNTWSKAGRNQDKVMLRDPITFKAEDGQKDSQVFETDHKKQQYVQDKGLSNKSKKLDWVKFITVLGKGQLEIW